MESKPFDGLTFCCTGITLVVRHDIATKITKLGGIHYSDLMSDVKYLIVGDRNTAKYKFCIKNRLDIEFINSESIITIYNLWLNGEDSTSDNFLLSRYKLNIFDGLNICLSRIEITNIDQFISNWRKKSDLVDYFQFSNLVNLITQNGGKVSESLTMNNDCIITTVPSGRRYTKGIEWKKPILHPIWIFDSILRGGALDFNDYLLNENNDYTNGFNWQDLIRTKPIVEPQIEKKTPKETQDKKRLRTDSGIWNSIMDKPIETKKRKMHDSWQEIQDEDDDNDDEGEEEKEKPHNFTELEEQLQPKLFSACKFLFLGFTANESKLLRKVIETNHGKISDSRDKSITHIIIPSKSGSNSESMLKTLPTNIKLSVTNNEIKVYTEWWVERCIFYQNIVNDSWGLPIKGMVPSSKSFKVCLSGFTGIELLHLEKLLLNLNLEYCSVLKSDRDLLIVNIQLYQEKLPQQLFANHQDVLQCGINNQVSLISTTNKINACKKWKIPIVSIGYIWQSLQDSINHSQLVFPDIINTNWCLFAPKHPSNFMEYIQNQTNSIETSSPSSIMKLPSPRKASEKKRYGPITGKRSEKNKSEEKPKTIEGAETTNPTNQELLNLNQDHYNENFDITDELTQIGYEDTDNNPLQLDRPVRMAAKRVIKYTR